jgi:hypothetical protein
MKIDPARPNPDLCQTSLTILRDRCDEWFSKRGESVWLPDLDFAPVPGAQNVVLTGGFLRRMAESGNWNLGTFRLWTLSHSVKRVLVSEFGLRASSIGVIPRYELFPGGNARRFSKGNEPFTLVFAGRVSPVKNIEMLIRTVWYLQRDLPVRLVMFGDFDDMVHPDWGRREKSDYRAHLERVVKSLRWRHVPEFRAKAGALDWMKSGKFENPVYTSFSTFTGEDFGVALAQAQSEGWPAWITAWGGHLECSQGAIRWIDSRLIGHSHESSRLIDLKARHLAANFQNSTATVEAPPNFVNPDPIAPTELDSARRRFFACPSMHLLYRDGVEAFADSEAGRKVFERLRRSFAAHPAEHWAILTGDFHAGRKLSALEARCSNILARAESEKKRVLFISARDLRASDNAWTLAHATRIFLPYETESLKPFVNGLKRQLGPYVPLTEFHDRI